MAKPETSHKAAYPADKARQGEIILKTQSGRIIFIAGLAGLFVLVLVLRIAGVL